MLGIALLVEKSIYQETIIGLSMCESLNPGKYPRPKVSFAADDAANEDEMKTEEAFTKLSAETIAKLIEDEPDIYSIEDVKVRYK